MKLSDYVVFIFVLFLACYLIVTTINSKAQQIKIFEIEQLVLEVEQKTGIAKQKNFFLEQKSFLLERKVFESEAVIFELQEKIIHLENFIMSKYYEDYQQKENATSSTRYRIERKEPRKK